MEPTPNTTHQGFMRGLHISNFLDTPAEWHALCQGAAETLAPWPPRHPGMHPDLYQDIANEHHYYVTGRALGVLAWLLFIFVVCLTFRLMAFQAAQALLPVPP